jgi:spermidine/putrescine ABC transporter ATP-binding subunit
MSTVSLSGVSKLFGEMRAVDDVSLDIASGEFVTLLGPSGCGKTTTLRMVAGLVEPDGGTIRLGGEDVTRVPTHKRNIGMVFQSHALFPHMTVAENVGFGLRMRGVSSNDRRGGVETALGLVRLEGFGARYPSQLSGGQQQRVALARALVFNPRVLLLDEPFGALDRKLRETMQGELRELVRRIGITAIFVTHDQEEALILSDRVGVMNAGRLEQIDSPGTIYERPATRFVADFMGAGNILGARIASIGAGIATLDAGGVAIATEALAGLKVGDTVDVALRAERIALAADGDASINAASGVVASAVYHGALSTYEVRLDGANETLLVVREPSTGEGGGTTRFAIGARVRTSWPASSVQILRN